MSGYRLKMSQLTDLMAKFKFEILRYSSHPISSAAFPAFRFMMPVSLWTMGVYAFQ